MLRATNAAELASENGNVAPPLPSIPLENSRASDKDESPRGKHKYQSPQASSRSAEGSTSLPKLPSIMDRSTSITSVTSKSSSFSSFSNKSQGKGHSFANIGARSVKSCEFNETTHDMQLSMVNKDGPTKYRHKESSKLPNIFQLADTFKERNSRKKESANRKTDLLRAEILYANEKTPVYISNKTDTTPRPETNSPRKDTTPSTPHQAALLLPMRGDELRQSKRMRKRAKNNPKVEHFVENKKPDRSSANTVSSLDETFAGENLIGSHGHGIKMKPNKSKNFSILKDAENSPRSAVITQRV